jgi:hypothetical protein
MKIAKFSIIRMTLTFDLEFIFKVKGQGWCSSWFGVSTTYSFKVVIFCVKNNKFQGQ